MRKSLALQADMLAEFGACVFDVTLDCEDGAPVEARPGACCHGCRDGSRRRRAGPCGGAGASVDHPAFFNDMATISAQAGHRLCHIMVPKVRSVRDVNLVEKALLRSICGPSACACPDQIPGGDLRAFEIAAHPVCSR